MTYNEQMKRAFLNIIDEPDLPLASFKAGLDPTIRVGSVAIWYDSDAANTLDIHYVKKIRDNLIRFADYYFAKPDLKDRIDFGRMLYQIGQLDGIADPISKEEGSIRFTSVIADLKVAPYLVPLLAAFDEITKLDIFPRRDSKVKVHWCGSAYVLPFFNLAVSRMKSGKTPMQYVLHECNAQ